MRRVVAQASPDLGREAVKLSTLADIEPRKNGAALEDSGKNRVASRMSGGVQSEQTLAHKVVSRGCLLNVKGRADVEVAKDRDRQEPNLDLQHRATQAQRVAPHAFGDDSRFLEIPIGRVSRKREHEVSVGAHPAQAIVCADELP